MLLMELLALALGKDFQSRSQYDNLGAQMVFKRAIMYYDNY